MSLPLPTVPTLPIETRAAGHDEWVLASGPSFGVVDVRLVLSEGAAADGNAAGLTALAWELTERGTATRDRSAFHADLERIGAELSFRTHRRSSQVVLRVLTEHLEPALDLVAEALLSARDDDDELERVKEETAEAIDVSLETPSGTVARATAVAVWGGTPWGVPLDGTEATRADIDRDAVAAQRLRLLSTPALIGVGADDPARVLPTVEAFVERVRSAAPVRTATPLDGPERAWGACMVADVDAPQGALAVLAPALGADSPHYAAVSLHATAFGDGFASPLVARLRAKEGLSYDVSWMVYPELGGGVHTFRCHPESVDVARALQVADEVWRAHADAPLDAETLERAKATYLGGRLLALETVERRLTIACSVRRLGLPVHRLWTLPADVAALDADAVRDAAARYAWHDGQRTIVAACRGGASASGWKERGYDATPLDVEETR